MSDRCEKFPRPEFPNYSVKLRRNQKEFEPQSMRADADRKKNAEEVGTTDDTQIKKNLLPKFVFVLSVFICRASVRLKTFSLLCVSAVNLVSGKQEMR